MAIVVCSACIVHVRVRNVQQCVPANYVSGVPVILPLQPRVLALFLAIVATPVRFALQLMSFLGLSLHVTY